MRMQKEVKVSRFGIIKSVKGDAGYFKADPVFTWKQGNC